MTIESLHLLYLQSTGISKDTRKIIKGNIYFALKGENFDGNLFSKKAIELGASFSVIDDDKYYVDHKTILVNDVLKTLQKLATYHRNYLNIPIIALTGSNGKTTTKELIYAVLNEKYNTIATQGNLNNHIGVPLTLLSMNSDTEIGVVEMGANHQGEIAFLCKIAQPDYGYITNFGKAHLEGFGGVEGVIKGKSELYDYLRKNKKSAFINNEDKLQIEKAISIQSFSFGTKNSSSDATIELVEANPFLKIDYSNTIIESKLIGAYNFSNIAAAIAIGAYFKVSSSAIKKGIESYTPTNNRSQIIKIGSNTIILDAYNANPSSMYVALENFNQLQNKNKTVILGDMFELGKDAANEHQQIVDLSESLGFNHIFLIGKNFFNTKSKTAQKFESFDDFKMYLVKNKVENTQILIKGSRGMALERVLNLI
ncbi:MAG: UDP-N-acetylmuramoyl-tripeptide--D-alanyl-D-alanine ligase [Flavobacteriaceae bacterium]|nr:UDP-N-acetylmuramoyl-tripeptide--D-alanyl-D-alanine ligase [Flavobacteriaceae bacterium]